MESDLGLDVAEHQISSMQLHDHLLGPQATFAVQPFQLGHAVVQRLQFLTIQLAGQKVLGREGRDEQSQKPVLFVRVGSHGFTSTLK